MRHPLTVGQELLVMQVKLWLKALKKHRTFLSEVALGGTAVGTG
jgi:fumarate hydratase class II